jgi:hypothetical protein
MLQELATGSGAAAWAVGSLLFFVVVYALVMVRLFRTSGEELDAQARMALDDDTECRGGLQSARSEARRGGL